LQIPKVADTITQIRQYFSYIIGCVYPAYANASLNSSKLDEIKGEQANPFRGG
jgi:hypothetical protein